MNTILTGVKPSGMPHVGNYIGAIRPALELAARSDVRSLLFIADYHALINVHDPKRLREMTYEVAATWLALGLDPQKTLIYRQSDIPEVLELCWILSCFTEKGLMNRAHAYKAKVAENEEAKRPHPDEGINMGLYSYPILMTADIVLFDADKVPVGADQLQHIEIARDIVQRFNFTYGDILRVPDALVQESTATIPGLDGRKMSKSYDNTIPLFLEPGKLRKLIMRIKTDSLPPEAPKDPKSSLLFDLYKHFGSPEEVKQLSERYAKGIGWGEVKETLFRAIDTTLAGPRQKYVALMSDPAKMDEILIDGAKRARVMATSLLSRVRNAIGCVAHK